jgi:hypothetical protein
VLVLHCVILESCPPSRREGGGGRGEKGGGRRGRGEKGGEGGKRVGGGEGNNVGYFNVVILSWQLRNQLQVTNFRQKTRPFLHFIGQHGLARVSCSWSVHMLQLPSIIGGNIVSRCSVDPDHGTALQLTGQVIGLCGLEVIHVVKTIAV